MTGPWDESVGESFEEHLLVSARDKTLEVIQKAARLFVPGTHEDEGRSIIKDLLAQSGYEKFWHAPQVRFGENTLRAFGEAGIPGLVLKENDIFFLDLGPVYGSHEGDVGRTFTVGDDPEMIKIAKDAEAIWFLVRDRWMKTQESGAQLYAHAQKVAKDLGWQLSLYEANGHRIADFPHIARQRGAIDGLDFKPAVNKWILEIQIKHPTRPFGAFYEDLLR